MSKHHNPLLIVWLLILTSCSTQYRFVTKGLRENDSSYYITQAGNRINAENIRITGRNIVADSNKIDADGLSAIKSKKRYFVINDGKLYETLIYGKVNLLYLVNSVNSYLKVANRSGSTDIIPAYYLQRTDTGAIEQLKHGTLVTYLSGNKKARTIAKAYDIWHYTNMASYAGYTAGGVYLGWSIGNYFWDGDVYRDFLVPGGAKQPRNFSTPFLIIVAAASSNILFSSLAHHKLRKAICIYDGIQ